MRRSWWGTQCCHQKLENSRESKRREKTPAHDTSCQPLRNPCPGKHLDWGRTLHWTIYGHGQGDWPETTRKLTPLPQNLRLSHPAVQCPWVPVPASLCLPGRPFPIKSFPLSADVSPQTVLFQMLDKSLPVLRFWKESPSWEEYQLAMVVVG